MKKIKHILFIGAALLMMSSCMEVDLKPKDQLDMNVLMGNELGIKTYLTSAYMRLPIEDFIYNAERGYNRDNWDLSRTYQGTLCGEFVGEKGGVQNTEGFDYWPYEEIRYVNTFLEALPAVRDKYTEDVYNAYVGEGRMLRAWYYFGMAKRYGGVPIVTTVQDATSSIDSLMVVRSTEDQTWQFIHDDLEFAMNNMTDKTGDPGRGNKYVAAALMSRAMLYAGTIAKYGDYTTASSERAAALGLVGIPAERANYYFQESLKGSTMVKTGPYELLGENLAREAKEQNYVDLFLTLNAEDIFVKQYKVNQGNRFSHSYDGCASPPAEGSGALDGMAQWPGSMWYPTLETVELFQKLPVDNTDGTPKRFNSREEMWQDSQLEPRMKANFFSTGDELRGRKFYLQRGVYVKYDGTIRDAQQGDIQAPSGINAPENRFLGGGKRWTYDPNNGNQTPWHDTWLKAVQDMGVDNHPTPGGDGKIDEQDMIISDYHGSWGGPEDQSMTGFFVRKYVDYRISIGQAAGNSVDHPWKVFRFAEILLNEAEASYELGQKDIAYENIRRIRQRAGASVWTPKATPGTSYLINGQVVDENLEYIREERARELLWENHRWFDIRRWRVADYVGFRADGGDATNPVTGIAGFTFALQRFRPHALYPYFVISEGKYIFLREYTTDWKEFTFNKVAYYEDIPGSEMSLVPGMVQNPLY